MTSMLIKRLKQISGDLLVMALSLSVLAGAATVLRHKQPTVAQISQPFPPHEIADARRILSAGNIIGSPNAELKLVEFSDFECPFCREFQGTVRVLLQRHPKKFAVLYRHFPLAMHPRAFMAAVASECAADQGRFEPYAELLFANQDSLGLVSWSDLANDADVPDVEQFTRCLDQPEARGRVESDVAVGKSLGIAGTPVIIFGNQIRVGALPLDTLEQILESTPKR